MLSLLKLKMIAWVSTQPNRKAPKISNIPAIRILSFDLFFDTVGSCISVVWRRHTPNNSKMKIAAKDPIRIITAPILGIGPSLCVCHRRLSDTMVPL